MASAYLPARRFGETTRRDAWWLQPAVTFVALMAFVVYSTWAAFQGRHYEFGNYLSPMYSPVLFGTSRHAWFGGPDIPTWWPGVLPYSAALLILWIPVGIRFTCYYYRGAYYKSFWGDPPSCAVGELRSKYRGEHSFPLIIQNIHRYFIYLAIVFIFILAYDAWRAFHFDAPGGGETFGVGVGSIVILLNTTLLAGYTFGCHSVRHVFGGVMDIMSGKPIRKAAYVCTSALNRRHMLFAWMSLIWVGFTDLYVRLCSMGVWTDLRIF